ncbi:MAG: TlyA family RNA methyltransferase [Candidatus Bruticola sp.]
MKSAKVRLDLLLVERALAPTREKAKSLLMTGQIFINGIRRDKAGYLVDENAEITVQGRGLPFSSRGGFKLEKALQTFSISPEGLIVADLGASTGGFTDCLLKGGAAKVYAVDVGKGLLDYKLVQNERVVVMDRTNARYLTPDMFAEPLDLITMDLSFISLELILPAAKELLADSGRIVCLVKPQFEAGPKNIKGGVVRRPEVHEQVLTKFMAFCQSIGLHLIDLTFSPIKGPAGNIEFLACLSGADQENTSDEPKKDSQQFFDIKELVARAWKEAK